MFKTHSKKTFLCLASLLIAVSAFAQRDRDILLKDASFKDRLWYGMGVGIGFGSFNGTSQFGLGFSPMVGYKIIEPISIGPRASIFYSSLKVRGYKNLNTFDSEIGVFVRGRVFKGLFLQGEASNSWLQEPYLDGAGLQTYKYQRFNKYLGLGYNFGNSDWSSEISAMYNISVGEDIQSSQSPWEYRFGITYRFW